MLDLFPANRGSAASVQTCVTLLVFSLCIGAVVPFIATTMWHLVAGSLACSLIASALWRVAR
jgi:DHA1 family bicyclomycin/chloramphenicol resistance-like MFS transporter